MLKPLFMILILIAVVHAGITHAKNVDITNHSTKTCYIIVPDFIYHTNEPNKVASNELITKSDCPSIIRNKFKEIILEFDNAVRADYLKNIFQNEFGDYRLHIHPDTIRVTNLQSRLRNDFNLKQIHHIDQISILNSSKIITHKNNESIEFRCKNCTFTGNKNIKTIIKNKQFGNKRTEWINATITVGTRVMTNHNHMAITNQALSPKQFKFNNINTTRPEQYFTDIKTLPFYKINKPMPKGTPLKYSDLTPINLVKFGHPVKVVIKQKSLVLTSTATPRRSGKYNDLIQLRTSANKIITGKVINFNKVIMEL